MSITSQPSINLFRALPISRHLILAIGLSLCGFSSVGSISLTMFELGSLPIFFSMWVVPSILIICILGLAYPQLGKLCLKGWLAGLIAVLLYDVSRIPFMLAGWDDFIPKIGVWLLERESAPASLGYLYRYAGNGGGMGVSFVLLSTFLIKPGKVVPAAVIYGIAVFCCLMLTLVFSPLGQDEMFEITLLTFSGSFIGHVIYGLVLGLALKRLISKGQ